MPDDRRRWKCPECAKEYMIPIAADDPMLCPACEPLSLPPVRPEHVMPAQKKGFSPLRVAVAVAALLAVAIWYGRREPAKPRPIERLPESAAQIRLPVVKDEPELPRRPPAPAQPEIAILALSDEKLEDYLTVQGRVKNLTGDNLGDVQATVTFYAGNAFVKSDFGFVTYNPMLPGQESPFTVVSSGNPRITRYTVEFSHFAGRKLISVDHREK